MPKQIKTLPPVRPNAGTEARYRRALQVMVKEMQKSVLYWLQAKYKANEPEIAADELPSVALKREIRKLAKRWNKQFDDAAPKLADYFAQAANKRSKLQLQKILKDAGISVEFKLTRAMRDVLNASIAEQVGLIKSIPQKYFTAVEGSVMRAVQNGGDVGMLTKELQDNYGVTFRRAALIARDQNSKAMATVTRVHQQQIGITDAVWVHSGGGKHPRPSHVAASKRGQKYKIAEGWYDPDVGKNIWPGELVSCRCVARSVIPGF